MAILPIQTRLHMLPRVAFGVIYEFIKPSLLGPCQIGPVQIAKKIVRLPVWTIIGIGDLYYNHAVIERDCSRRPGVKTPVLVVRCAEIVGLYEVVIQSLGVAD